MNNNSDRARFWNDQVWAAIDDGVTKAVGAIRVAQKVFPATQLTGVTSVPADVFDPKEMKIDEGKTRAYVELAVEFTLTNGQVSDDTTGTTAITLSKLAAKSLALAEDIIMLQGTKVKLPPRVEIESGRDAAEQGILDLVISNPIVVKAPDPGAPTNSGGEILAAITQGIAELTNHVQAPPYALIEDTNAFAATWGSVINGAPAYTVLTPLLTGGIYGTGAMPPNTGLLVALGGDPTTIYFDSDPMTEPTTRAARGRYSFRTFERIQFVARDNRAFVKLDFSYLGQKIRYERESSISIDEIRTDRLVNK
jgi:uncharacterized linocin/CFP29 family protein